MTVIHYLTCAVMLAAGATAFAESTIDPQDLGLRYGWSENGGWLNLKGNATDGVRVNIHYLEGFAWHENFGYINFGNGAPAGSQYSNSTGTDFGVNVDSQGHLSGYAWGENIGWIALDTTAAGGSRVSIDQTTGRFSGSAWGENVGWITFDTVSPAHVAHTALRSGAANWLQYR